MSLNPMRNIYLWQQPSCASQSASHRYVQTSGIRLRIDILTWNDLKQMPRRSATQKKGLHLWISKLLNHLESACVLLTWAAQSPTRGDPTSEDWAASTDAESGMERERPKFAMVGLNLPGMLLVSGCLWWCWTSLELSTTCCYRNVAKKMQWTQWPNFGMRLCTSTAATSSHFLRNSPRIPSETGAAFACICC